jgi:hypothetical protein
MIRKIKGFLSVKRTIQVDLMLALILIAILPVSLVNQFYYNNTRSFIEEKVKNYNNEIVKQTGASTATISRVNRSLTNGCDSYEKVFARLEADEK